MTQAKNGDKVKVRYVGKFTNGEIFDNSKEKNPLEFTLGDDNIMAAFQQAVIGMEPGQSKTTTIPSQEAYGARDKDKAVKVKRDDLPKGLNPEVGQQLKAQEEGGRTIPVLVTAIDEESVTLDINHPLAGKDLLFDIHLAEIVSG